MTAMLLFFVKLRKLVISSVALASALVTTRKNPADFCWGYLKMSPGRVSYDAVCMSVNREFFAHYYLHWYFLLSFVWTAKDTSLHREGMYVAW